MSQWREHGTLARYILPASGTMIGMCTTLIGLVKILEARTGPSRADEFTALAALCFLVSALASYLTIRHGHRRLLSVPMEAIADTAFLLGLVGIGGIGLFYAYELI
ncbi:MAG: hypothetical protein JOZ70_08115 [Pseudolabrys sp.]|nr:hypothetical protein [Pseudolabrys sp.]MBV9955202.1 hypothetical protein [Pseudolabrys sp.]